MNETTYTVSSGTLNPTQLNERNKLGNVVWVWVLALGRLREHWCNSPVDIHTAWSNFIRSSLMYLLVQLVHLLAVRTVHVLHPLHVLATLSVRRAWLLSDWNYDRTRNIAPRRSRDLLRVPRRTINNLQSRAIERRYRSY